MQLIIGLGNPGPKYKNQRHNLGFMVVDLLASKLGLKFKEAVRLNAEIAEGEVLLAKPQTFMNNSGVAVSKIMRKYNLSAGDILVISDDLDLAFGTLRLREKGSSGGHNGLKSIIDTLGTPDFRRLKIGIGRHPTIDSRSYVLQNFSPEEKAKLPDILKQAVDLLSK